ncbi:MAG: DNA polymerase III subunit delta' [Clostridiales bacterium]|nr:DNA polymerase III subunit delta' [Clostridiales bacterium]
MTEQLENQDVFAHIRRAARENVLGHALIFSGPGNRLGAARYAAAALECENPSEAPCLHCESCRKVMAQIHPDIISVHSDVRVEIPVEDMRALKQDVYVRPNEGKYKIYFFDRCEQLNIKDQNTLLKILEEGPPYAAFFFCPENSAILLPTVRSRCIEWKLQHEGAEDLTQSAELCRLMAGDDATAVVSFFVRLEGKKPSREKVQALLQGSWQTAAAALLSRFDKATVSPEAALLARRFNKAQLLRLTALLERYSKECDYNVNVGLVLGAVAAEWEGIL